MTKPPKPDNPHRIKVKFRQRYGGDPAHELVLVMQRFVARICHEFPNAVVKGGLGLELRLGARRTTLDADVIITGSHDLDARLERAGLLDLGDFMRFRVNKAEDGAEFVVPGMPYPGRRYTIQACFTDKLPDHLRTHDVYRKFTLEVSIRDPAGFEVFESAWDGLPQISKVPIRVYSLAWQLAEKLHAYCDPRHRESENPDRWRPRDLLDICRCAHVRSEHVEVEAQSLRTAIEQTFARRKAAAQDVVLPEIPDKLPPLPVSWEPAFFEHVRQGSLPWTTPAHAHEVAAAFIDPVLDGNASGTWNPESKTWHESAQLDPAALLFES